jgi:AraC-like DNA-binding protein
MDSGQHQKPGIPKQFMMATESKQEDTLCLTLPKPSDSIGYGLTTRGTKGLSRIAIMSGKPFLNFPEYRGGIAMHGTAEQAVERVIDTMRCNLSEQLTVDDMARAAMFSKFHFTRLFQRVTGVSPGRFLSALRLQEAKRLLTMTRLNVTDISLLVGYNSVGTFSTRFTRSVGLPPTTYRRMGGYQRRIPTLGPSALGHNVITGRVTRAPGTEEYEPIFMGLFQHRIPEGPPARCAILEEPGAYHFADVPDGSWHLLCQSVSDDSLALEQRLITVSTTGPLVVRGGQVLSADAELKPVSKVDPPVLLALLDSRKAAMTRHSHTRPERYAA